MILPSHMYVPVYCQYSVRTSHTRFLRCEQFHAGVLACPTAIEKHFKCRTMRASWVVPGVQLCACTSAVSALQANRNKVVRGTSVVRRICSGGGLFPRIWQECAQVRGGSKVVEILLAHPYWSLLNNLLSKRLPSQIPGTNKKKVTGFFSSYY